MRHVLEVAWPSIILVQDTWQLSFTFCYQPSSVELLEEKRVQNFHPVSLSRVYDDPMVEHEAGFMPLDSITWQMAESAAAGKRVWSSSKIPGDD